MTRRAHDDQFHEQTVADDLKPAALVAMGLMLGLETYHTLHRVCGL